jgi:hypothetical protein
MSTSTTSNTAHLIKLNEYAFHIASTYFIQHTHTLQPHLHTNKQSDTPNLNSKAYTRIYRTNAQRTISKAT